MCTFSFFPLFSFNLRLTRSYRDFSLINFLLESLKEISFFCCAKGHMYFNASDIFTILPQKDIFSYFFMTLQNVHTSAWFFTIMCMVSFGLWLDIVCIIFIFVVTFGFVVATECKYNHGYNECCRIQLTKEVRISDLFVNINAS